MGPWVDAEDAMSVLLSSSASTDQLNRRTLACLPLSAIISPLINMKLSIYCMHPQPASLYNTHPEPAPSMLLYVIYQLSITPSNQLVRCMLLLFGCPQLDIHNRNVCSSYSSHGISNFDQPTFLD